MDNTHFNHSPRRDASFIKPPNILKAKVGSGGLDERTLDRAQSILENNTADFKPVADIYLDDLANGIAYAKNPEHTGEDSETLIAGILFPAVQLKANGGMFHFKLVTHIAERYVQFLEVIENINADVLDIATAFHTTIKLIVTSALKDINSAQGTALTDELNKAYARYFEKYKA
jgi:hypothetical protein